MPAYDAIVLGLGGMGSATLFHLARRGLRVLGLERFDLVHEYGSSHGLTRIIRLAYWEHPTYVALLRRAYELWRELESLAGERLLHITGSVDAGPEGGAVFSGALKSSELHGLRARGPGRRRAAPALPRLPPAQGAQVSLPARGRASSCPSAATWPTWSRRWPWARRCGAARRCSTGRRTAGACGCGRPGEVYEAGRLVICAGPWASKLVPELAGLAVPERQVLAWLQPTRPDRFRPATFPVFNLEVEEGRFYGFPSFLIPGFKFGKYHHRGENVDPDTVNRNPEPEDEELLRAFARRYFPEGEGPTLMLKACMFTNTPDRHFILDRHPAHPEISIAAGFSGHGYKFCSVIGEVMADLVQDERGRHDIEFFRLGRFGGPRPP